LAGALDGAHAGLRGRGGRYDLTTPASPATIVDLGKGLPSPPERRLPGAATRTALPDYPARWRFAT